jgi:hypothetical protein
MTGSREHIFPAALGGRRTNKGIYCGEHNNAYSGLAGIISEQLAIFNALLGVVGDHADKATTVLMEEGASEQQYIFSKSRLELAGPREISKEIANNETKIRMAFRNEREAETWIKEQEAQGLKVKIDGAPQKMRYYPGPVHKEVTLGGTAEGIRAIGYIAQTFLAHHFPQIARKPELDGIKNYTLNNVGTDFAWWDFSPPEDIPPNSFPFGHRIIVGLNQSNGTAYARVSFFSTLNFAILFGNVSVDKNCAVISDIDPLAKSPPKDITVLTVDTALGAVTRPSVLSASLSHAIHSGGAQALVQKLMQQIEDHERNTASSLIIEKTRGAATLPASDRDDLFSSIVVDEAQRVVNLMQYVAKDAERRAGNPIERAIADFLQKAVKLDSMAPNGLSGEAAISLAKVSKALAKQMADDCMAGVLDQDRLAMLLGGGPGAALVGKVLLDDFHNHYFKRQKT